MNRLHHDKDLVDIVEEGRLSILHDDAEHVLRRLLLRRMQGTGDAAAAMPDVVYMDPMFPRAEGRGKGSRAAPRLGSQVLAAVVRAGARDQLDELEGAHSGSESIDRAGMLRLAMLVADERVVVKSHSSVPPIDGVITMPYGSGSATTRGATITNEDTLDDADSNISHRAITQSEFTAPGMDTTGSAFARHTLPEAQQQAVSLASRAAGLAALHETHPIGKPMFSV